MAEKLLKHTTLIIKEKSNVKIDGVENVLSFDESYVSLMTVSGKIIIEGENLKIESLTKDNGEILICGKISGALYEEQKAAKGVLSRIFK